jgi:prohibitin 2
MKVKLAVACAIGLLVYKEGIFNVPGGHRALIFNRLNGVQDNIYAEGLYFKVPFRD